MSDEAILALDEAIAAVWFAAQKFGLTYEEVENAWRLHAQHADCFGVTD